MIGQLSPKHARANISSSASPFQYVLVTGSNRGIGLGLVEYLLKQRGNYFVIATCRNPSNATQLRSLVTQYPTRSTIIALDVSSESSVAESVAAVSKLTPRLDLLINNAAIAATSHPWESVLEVDPSEMSHILSVNVISQVTMFKAYHDLLRGGGKVLNISSSLGSIELNTDESKCTTSYRVSKAALNMLTRCQAVQSGVKDNIIVTAVHPGHVKTDMGTSNGKRSAALEVHESCQGIVELAEVMQMQTHNGAFYDWTGQQLPW